MNIKNSDNIVLLKIKKKKKATSFEADKVQSKVIDFRLFLVYFISHQITIVSISLLKFSMLSPMFCMLTARNMLLCRE